MRNLLIACALVIGAIVALGFIRGETDDRMRLTTITESRGLTLVVSMPDVTSRYEVLHVEGCSAEITENGVACLFDGWSSRSDRAISRAQESIPFRGTPQGTLHFSAVAVDRDLRVLASSQLTLLRGF